MNEPFIKPQTEIDLCSVGIEWASSEYHKSTRRNANTLFIAENLVPRARAITDLTAANFDISLRIWPVYGWPDGWWSVGELMIYGYGSVGA